MGEHIVSLVPSGDVALFIATPGSLNIQPRIDGALSVLKAHPGIKTHVVATGAAVPQEHSVIDSYLAGHPNTAGMFAVDGGSTEGVGLAIQKHNATGKVKGGGYGRRRPRTAGVRRRDGVTIDQQPYLQGFLPILELYMYNVTQKLSGIADVNTGIKSWTKRRWRRTFPPRAVTRVRVQVQAFRRRSSPASPSPRQRMSATSQPARHPPSGSGHQTAGPQAGP